jgi:hypothetical protein
MKTIVIALILLSSVVAYAEDPYVKALYRNKNWTVQQVAELVNENETPPATI